MKNENNEVKIEEEVKDVETVETVPEIPAACTCENKTHPWGALILGILSVCFGSSLLSLQLAGLITGIIGIVFGYKAKNERENSEVAKTAMILSIIGLVLNVLNIIIFGAFAVVVYHAIEVMPRFGYHLNTVHCMY